MPSPITRRLLAWYRRHARRLPWRGRRDPYAIWVSEIMLQQTRVETVIPYYKRWMKRFPALRHLAAASNDEVLRYWEGLGYYHRALHLHRAAQDLMAEGKGALPRSAEELERLPGVGRYTAAAIAALAFKADLVAIDGNLQRVLSRLIDLRIDPRSPNGDRRLRQAANRMLPPGRAAEFNQALMDLGATVCTPRAPHCDRCPVALDCLARIRGTQDRRPVRAVKEALPHRAAVAGILRRRGRVLIARRPEGGLLGGLWEFPGGKQERGETLRAGLKREMREELGIVVSVGKPAGVFTHAYTHFSVTLHAFECEVRAGRPAAREHTAIRWIRPDELASYPMGKLAREIAKSILAGSPNGRHGRADRRRQL